MSDELRSSEEMANLRNVAFSASKHGAPVTVDGSTLLHLLECAETPPGITYRQLLAAIALKELLRGHQEWRADPDGTGWTAVHHADAVIASLGKGESRDV